MKQTILIGPSSSWVILQALERSNPGAHWLIWCTGRWILFSSCRKGGISDQKSWLLGWRLLPAHLSLQVTPGFLIVDISRVCILERSPQGRTHFRSSFSTNISSYVIQNVTKELQIPREVHIAKALTMGSQYVKDQTSGIRIGQCRLKNQLLILSMFPSPLSQVHRRVFCHPHDNIAASFLFTAAGKFSDQWWK